MFEISLIINCWYVVPAMHFTKSSNWNLCQKIPMVCKWVRFMNTSSQPECRIREVQKTRWGVDSPWRQYGQATSARFAIRKPLQFHKSQKLATTWHGWLNKSNTKCTILIHLGNISSNMQRAVETKLWNHSKLQPENTLIFQNFLCLASFQVSYSYSGAPSHLVPHLNE